MSKTGPEIRHEAKERMKKYRAEMVAKGYISTTVFLSKEHRAELKRLGDEYRLTRAEAAEHIFQAYLQSDNKDVTQTHNINTGQLAENLATIKALDARLKALEEKARIEKIEAQVPIKEKIEWGDGQTMLVLGKNKTKPEVKPPALVKPVKPIQETQTEIPGPEPKQGIPKRGTPEYSEWLYNEIKRLRGAGLGWVDMAKKFNSNNTKPSKAERWSGGGHLRSSYVSIEKKLAGQS